MEYDVVLVLKDGQGACIISVDADIPEQALSMVSNIICRESMTATGLGRMAFMLAERITHNGSREPAMVNVDHIAFLRIDNR